MKGLIWMRKLTFIVVLLILALTLAAPAWADSPGIEVVTGWAANQTGLTVANTLGSSSGGTGIATGPGIPGEDQMKLDSIGAIEAAYKLNSTGVENALGTFHNDIPVAYSSGLIAYMARVGFNPATVGGPNIPPGSVTPAMMPNGYLLIDQIGPGGWAVQIHPGETPKTLQGVVSTTTPKTVSSSTTATQPQYVKPQPQEVQTKPTTQEVATTSPSVPAPGKGTSAPQKLTPDQQKAAAMHVPENYVTNPPKTNIPKPQATPAPTTFPWKWVFIGGGAALLIALAAVFVIKNRRSQYGW